MSRQRLGGAGVLGQQALDAPLDGRGHDRVPAEGGTDHSVQLVLQVQQALRVVTNCANRCKLILCKLSFLETIKRTVLEIFIQVSIFNLIIFHIISFEGGGEEEKIYLLLKSPVYIRAICYGK